MLQKAPVIHEQNQYKYSISCCQTSIILTHSLNASYLCAVHQKESDVLALRRTEKQNSVDYFEWYTCIIVTSKHIRGLHVSVSKLQSQFFQIRY